MVYIFKVTREVSAVNENKISQIEFKSGEDFDRVDFKAGLISPMRMFCNNNV